MFYYLNQESDNSVLILQYPVDSIFLMKGVVILGFIL